MIFAPRRVLGIDGTKGGWVGVVLADGRFERALLRELLAECFIGNETAERIGVDMPICLPCGNGVREAEEEVRPRGCGARAFGRGGSCWRLHLVLKRPVDARFDEMKARAALDN